MECVCVVVGVFSMNQLSRKTSITSNTGRYYQQVKGEIIFIQLYQVHIMTFGDSVKFFIYVTLVLQINSLSAKRSVEMALWSKHISRASKFSCEPRPKALLLSSLIKGVNIRNIIPKRTVLHR